MLPILLAILPLIQSAAPAADPEGPATPAPDVEVVAGRETREGTVDLECTVQQDGRVSDCIVRAENPRGQGFGEAALNAARRARLSRGSVQGGKVRFRTTFRLPDTPPA
jgi:TonB family protein